MHNAQLSPIVTKILTADQKVHPRHQTEPLTTQFRNSMPQQKDDARRRPWTLELEHKPVNARDATKPALHSSPAHPKPSLTPLRQNQRDDPVALRLACPTGPKEIARPAPGGDPGWLSHPAAQVGKRRRRATHATHLARLPPAAVRGVGAEHQQQRQRAGRGVEGRHGQLEGRLDGHALEHRRVLAKRSNTNKRQTMNTSPTDSFRVEQQAS